MGMILSLFRKTPDTKTLLAQIQGEIESIEEYKWTVLKRQKNYIGLLFLVSGLIYVLSALVFYFVYLPTSASFRKKILYALPLVIFPIIVWSLKRSLQWYYRWVIDTNDDRLRQLKKQKQKILEKVQETETFKDAKEILEKYDPKALQELSRRNFEMFGTATPQGPAMNPNLRYRGTPATPATAGSFMRTPMAMPRFAPGLGPATPRPVAGPSHGPMPRLALMAPPPPRHVKPILPQDRGIVEKLIDYVVGDGPSNRYALICRNCHSHNGMALKEEFEYIEFNCCYCFHRNPPRKVRPFAPTLASASAGRPSLAPVVDEPESDNDSTTKETTAGGADVSKMKIEEVSNANDDESISITNESLVERNEIDSKEVSEETKENLRQEKLEKEAKDVNGLSSNEVDEIEFIDKEECQNTQSQVEDSKSEIEESKDFS